MPLLSIRSFLDWNLLLLAVAILLPSQATAGQGTKLVLADGTRSFATLVEYDFNSESSTWRFENVAGEMVQSTTNQLVRWGHPAKAKRATTLVLRDGSTLVTDRTWAASGYVRVDEELVGLNRRDGWATVKRSEAAWLLLEAAIEGTDKEELLRSTVGKQNEHDLLWLVGGDQIEGVIHTVGNAEVSIFLGKDTMPTEIPISRIRAIRFAVEPQKKQQQPASLVGLEDGTLLVARSVQGTEQQATVETIAGLNLEIETEAIVFLQPVAGAIRYLSERAADDYRSTPYFDLAWPYARNASIEGTPLVADGHQYAKGLAMHSAARLVYQLSDQDIDQPLRFQADLAIADATPSIGSVVFRVYVIRDSKVVPIYKSLVIRGGDTPLPLDVDISGASTLVLVVDYADNGDTGDQALWLDARLVRVN